MELIKCRDDESCNKISEEQKQQQQQPTADRKEAIPLQLFAD